MKRVSALLCALLVLPASALAARQSPVDNGVVTSGVGWRPDPFGSGRMVYHSGYDIAVPVGTPVHPTQTGTVFFAGPYKGYGNLVGIDHGNGYLTFYGHNSALVAKVGDKVDTDTVIALSGSTGHSTGPHVHYEMRRWAGHDKRPAEQSTDTVPNLAAGKGTDPAAGGMGGGDDAGRLPPEGLNE